MEAYTVSKNNKETRMGISDTRCKNMLWLIENRFNGSRINFGEAVGLSSSEISRIISPSQARNIGNKKAREIEEKLGLPDGSFDKTDAYSSNEDKLIDFPLPYESIRLGYVDTWDNKTPLGVEEVEVPYYMDVELAAGFGSQDQHEDTGLKLRFSKSFFRRKNVQPENAACVRITGDSMEPKLSDGDLVAVDCAFTKIVDGRTYAINHDGLLRVKKLYHLPGGSIRIVSINKEEYPDEIVSIDNRERIKVIGKVFHSQSEDW